MPKGDWKEYFVFSKKERSAIFILLGLMAAFIFLTFWYKPVFTQPVIDGAVQQKLAVISAKHNTLTTDSLDEEAADSTKETYTPKPAVVHELFYFDPNTLDADGLRKLGFGEKTAEHIIEYRKTARFKKPEDLYNIPRIRKKVVEKVLPYVKIGTGAITTPAKIDQPVAAKQAPAGAATPAGNYKAININTAVAADFKIFPGVTDAVANRIIKFRTSINGFKSVDDVAKTYGLPAQSFNTMKPYLRLQ